MAAVNDALSNLTEAAQAVGTNNASTFPFNDGNVTDLWTIGPDGEFDGDPEEPKFAVLVFYCILVGGLKSAPDSWALPLRTP